MLDINKIIYKIRNQASTEKVTYSFKIEKEHAEILKEFFNKNKIAPSDFFNVLIDYEALKKSINQDK